MRLGPDQPGQLGVRAGLTAVLVPPGLPSALLLLGLTGGDGVPLQVGQHLARPELGRPGRGASLEVAGREFAGQNLEPLVLEVRLGVGPASRGPPVETLVPGRLA